MLKRTPLFQAHQKLGARLVEFGGWEMPVQYTSIVDEHLAVRQAGGIFDISHMGEIFVSGPAALDFLNSALTNDLRKISPGQGQYTLMCNDQGGVVDDLYLYCLGLGNYLLIVNASRIEADFEWLQTRHASFDRGAKVFLENKSESYAAVAIQGPKVRQFVDQCFANEEESHQLAALKKNELKMLSHFGELIYVASTGYTGEDGFEVIAPSPLIERIWWKVLEAGESYGLKPAGLGARDTLRTEMCYPLYGHELNESTTPLEAGLGFFVSLEKGHFIGSERLLQQKIQGVPRKLAAFRMAGKAPPPRPDYRILSLQQELLGVVTSGTQSPSLNVGIGLGYVPPGEAKAGAEIQVEVRGRTFPAVIASKPLYKKS